MELDGRWLASINVTTNYPEFLDFVCVNTDAEFACNQWEQSDKL